MKLPFALLALSLFFSAVSADFAIDSKCDMCTVLADEASTKFSSLDTMTLLRMNAAINFTEAIFQEQPDVLKVIWKC